MMERSPVITLRFHLRMMTVLAILGFADSYFVSNAYFVTMQRGASAQIVFGFEYAILLALVLHVTIKYLLHMHDLRNPQSWDNKAVYLLYAELFINLIRCILYGFFAVIMLRVHTFPLFSVRPFYQSVRALQNRSTDSANENSGSRADPSTSSGTTSWGAPRAKFECEQQLKPKSEPNGMN